MITIVLTFAIVVSACGDDSEPVAEGAVTTVADVAPDTTATTLSMPSAGGIDTPSNPASVDIALDDANTVSMNIGRAGGILSASGPDGIEYELVISEGALLSEIEISMTPMSAVSGDAIGETFVAGVDLEPTGLVFLGDVELRISGPGLSDAIAWGAENGDDFHLTTSDQADDTHTIPIIHFSDLGLATRQVIDLIESEGIISEDLDARLQSALVTASDATAIALATQMAEAFTIEGFGGGDPNGDYQLFEDWSSDVLTHLFRIDIIMERRGWGPDTPGIDDLLSAVYGLVDSWFQGGDAIVAQQAAACEDGHIEGAFRTLRQAMIGLFAVGLLGRIDEADVDVDYQYDVLDYYITNWSDIGVDCLIFGVTWQARIVTTGQGFISDINIGAEAVPSLSDDFDSLEWLISRGSSLGNAQSLSFELPSVPMVTDLEVEWVDGFFAQPTLGCEPASGRVEMEYYDFDVYLPNVGNFGDVIIESTPFQLRVKILEPITLNCNPPGTTFSADAAYPFHLGALEYLNGEFTISGYWYFGMLYEPGGGEIARFEQGSPVDGEGEVFDAPDLDFPTGKYELWQLVTVFQD